MSRSIPSIVLALLAALLVSFRASAAPTSSPGTEGAREDLDVTRNNDRSPGTADVMALNAMVGDVTGARLELFPFSTGIFKLGLEFAGGYAVSSAGLAPGIDFGLRAQLRVLSGRRDAFYVSPGISALIVFGDDHACGSGWFAPPCTNVLFVGPDLNLSWVHYTSERFAFELGLFGGLGVALAGTTEHGNAQGMLTPRAGFFIGFRG
jgi:hypothetical protein